MKIWTPWEEFGEIWQDWLWIPAAYSGFALVRSETVFLRYLGQISLDLNFQYSILKLFLSTLKWDIVTKINWQLEK